MATGRPWRELGTAITCILGGALLDLLLGLTLFAGTGIAVGAIVAWLVLP